MAKYSKIHEFYNLITVVYFTSLCSDIVHAQMDNKMYEPEDDEKLRLALHIRWR